MSKIQEFFNEQFGTVRTIILDGQIYFVGIDISKALGYSNAAKAVSTHCKRPVKTEIDVSSQNMSINTCAKELGIGEYKLFAFLRSKKVFFYDKDMVNVPYQRFMNEGKFVVKETPCHDREMRSVTYATKKGLDYMRKLLRKNGYYDKLVAE